MTFHPNPSWDPPQHHKVVRPVQLYRRVNVSSPESETRVSFFTACGSVLGLTRAYSAFGGESSAMVCKAARGSLSTEGGTFAPQWSRVVKLMPRAQFPLRETNTTVRSDLTRADCNVDLHATPGMYSPCWNVTIPGGEAMIAARATSAETEAAIERRIIWTNSNSPQHTLQTVEYNSHVRVTGCTCRPETALSCGPPS